MMLFKYIVLGVGRVHDTPVKEVDMVPAFEYSDVEVTTDDKVKLRAYLVKPRVVNKDTCFFLVCHGTGCNQYSYSPICSKSGPLCAKNVCVLFADYREFGASEGQFTMEGVSRDIDAYLRYMRETLKAERVHLWGHSLGAAVILRYACHVKAEACEKLCGKIILVSMFTHFRRAVVGGIKSCVWGEHLATTIYDFLFGATVGEHFSYDNLEAIECVDAKDVLIIHSDADEMNSREEAVELSKKSGAALRITQGDHNHAIGDPEAWMHVFEFVSCSDMPVQENPPVFSGKAHAGVASGVLSE